MMPDNADFVKRAALTSRIKLGHLNRRSLCSWEKGAAKQFVIPA